MRKMLSAIFALLGVISCAVGYPLEEHYGYIEVRPGAYMFSVLYENDAMAGGLWTDYPLIMWLQGGPGSSGVGYGNFWELGPYDTNYDMRPGRWTQKANVLFVDQPVGTGYSYVEDPSLYTTTNHEIAVDLVEFTRQLFSQISDLQTMPFFVYAESYGGKMAVDYALELEKAINSGNITANFQGVALGNSWISPMDTVNTWAPFLYGTGYVNEQEMAILQESADSVQQAVDEEDWVLATNRWGLLEIDVLRETGGIDFYNVFATTEVYQAVRNHEKKLDSMSPLLRELYEQNVLPFQFRSDLDDFMNGVQKERWNISDSVTWGGQSDQVFLFLEGDFMKPVIDSAVQLLETTNLHLSVYSGDWDLMCDTPGTYKWINEMNWSGKEDFENARRERLFISAYDPQAGYVQRSGQFSLFTLLRSGHMAPIDQPQLCLQMIDMITSYAAETTAAEQAKRKTKEAKATKRKSEKQRGELNKEIEEITKQNKAYEKHEKTQEQLKGPAKSGPKVHKRGHKFAPRHRTKH